jgi:hypothetical protein
MFIPHLILPNSVVVTSPDGTPVSIDKSHYNYDEVVTLLTTSSGTYNQIIDLMQPIREFRRALSTSNFYENADGLVCIDLDGYPFVLPAELQQEVLRINRSNGNLTPLENFVTNLAANPDKKVHDQLYGFISACGLTLTEDGHFLAYKKVRDDFMDIYSGTVDNSPGTTLKPMPRWACDSNPNNTCSSGYHFAAWGYLQHYGASHNNRIVIVKVDPAEVVAIPVDYNNMKGRACTYKVLKEIAVPEELKNTSVYYDDDESNDEFGDGWADDDFEDYEEEQEDGSEKDPRAAAKDELLKVMSDEAAEELLDLVERMAASLK